MPSHNDCISLIYLLIIANLEIINACNNKPFNSYNKEIDKKEEMFTDVYILGIVKVHVPFITPFTQNSASFLS